MVRTYLPYSHFGFIIHTTLWKANLMQLHIIGSGCPDPFANRFGSSFILQIGDEHLMVDCGPAATYKMAHMGLHPRVVSHLFFTHHHFDHNADFPCFGLVWWDQSTDESTPLQIFGPPPTARFVEGILGKEGAFREDIAARLTHPASEACHQQRGGPLPRWWPNFPVKEVAEGAVTESDHWRCTCTTVHHVDPLLHSLAFRFETDEGSVVFAGDCGDCPAIREFAKGADTLVLACTHYGLTEMNVDIVNVITGIPEVTSIACEAGVGRVVLTHANKPFGTPRVKCDAIAKIARQFEGDILFPEEKTTVTLK